MWGIIGTWGFALEPVRRGAQQLRQGADAMDVLVEASTAVEDDVAVDSVGTGGLPNWAGEVELDAAVMDGRTLAIGAVAAMRGFPHPTAIARDVLIHTRHTLLAGPGAEDFARHMGYTPQDLRTEATMEKWRRLKEIADPPYIGHDTVGLVALSPDGHLCVSTSTSGMGLKLPGRVGDSPLVGAGFYADEGFGGAAATGLGEDIMKGMASFRAVEALRRGACAQDAATEAVMRTHEALAARGFNPGNIAVIVMDRAGGFGGAANHEGFVYAAASEGREAALYEVAPCVRRLSSGTEAETHNNVQLRGGHDDVARR